MIDYFDDYESPISMEIRKVAEKIVEKRDNQILATIQEECQIKINKFELMRALNYDRDQYKKGFEDAKKKFERSKGKWVGINEYLKHLEEEYGEKYKVSSLYDGSIFCDKCWSMSKSKSCYCSDCGAEMITEVIEE